MSNTIEYGIDLGTTNSCIARCEGDGVRIFQNNDQMNVTPSAVHILRSGRTIVGRRGHAALLTDPENVAVEFKRWMGQKDRKSFPASQRELSAEELSAEILKSLKEDVRRQTGNDVRAAVVTVPAAFGALQCEATARAAALAGLEEAPLLQEPIAAAIGYGTSAGSANQRWLVFDLGGGTLDIAVVSTREGRLNILEHRGNNLLGGKDIDRAIVENVLLPALQATYDLRASGPNTARSRLLPRLRIKAEEAKVDLSTDADVVISLFDIGADDSGIPIELDVPFKRSQLEALMDPLVERCIQLAQEALVGARVNGADLDRILLVGGPTQAPCLRSTLTTRLGAPVDFSADPMTVVGRGAALYAATLERTRASVSVRPAKCLHLKLAYEPVSAEAECEVAGRVADAPPDLEIKIESEGALWTSGWMKLLDGCFETPVSLKTGSVTTFWIYARDGTGQLLETDTPEFTVRHGLVPSAPPLPHTLSVEIVSSGEEFMLDPVFSKGSPLPTEKTVKYRAAHALLPDNPDSGLAIKLWEGEYLGDPDANEWVGNIVLAHDGVKRSVPEGTEIEVTIQVDASRIITVEAFVPRLDQRFSGRLFVPQREEQDFSDISRGVAAEAQAYRRRLDEIERTLSGTEDEATLHEVAEVRRNLDALDATSPGGRSAERTDPDDARRVVEGSKHVRGQLGRLERRTVGSGKPLDSVHFVELMEHASAVVTQFGIALDKQQFAMLRREFERAAAKGDEKAFQRVCGELDGLRWRVLYRHDWFWREIFDSLKQPGVPFIHPSEAQRLIADGQAAVSGGDGEGLKKAVRGLWQLQPKDAAAAVRERAVRSGLRKF